MRQRLLLLALPPPAVTLRSGPTLGRLLPLAVACTRAHP
jgi:hypothetical protein